MVGRRATVGLTLLCALVFCAFAAASASATGTTAFTCVEGQGEKDFTDAHCDNKVKAGAGKFGHVEIAPENTTEFELTNEKTAEGTTAATPSVLTGELGGIKAVEITCQTIKGTGSLTNKLIKGEMGVEGTATIEHSKCTVAKPSGCTVKEPIVYSTKFQTFQNETEMGVEFTPQSGGEFGAISYLGKSCALNGQTIGISGVFKGRPGGTAQGIGATLSFDDAGTLKWGSNTYTLTGKITLRMKEGNAIDFTTK